MNRLTELADPYLRKSHLVTDRGVARTQLFYAQTGKILKKYLPRVAATIGTTLSERICLRREQKFESIDFVISKCQKSSAEITQYAQLAGPGVGCVCVCGGGGGGGMCASQYFETYPIHIPGLWKNKPIHILDRPKCWPIHILPSQRLPFDFYTHLLLVIRQI